MQANLDLSTQQDFSNSFDIWPLARLTHGVSPLFITRLSILAPWRQHKQETRFCPINLLPFLDMYSASLIFFILVDTPKNGMFIDTGNI